MSSATAPGERRAAWVLVGEMLLFGLFIMCLAGRFTLDRVSPELPAVDLRWAGVIALLLAGLFWFAGMPARERAAIRIANGMIALYIWAGWSLATSLWAPPTAQLGEAIENLVLLVIIVTFASVIASVLPEQALARLWLWFVIAAILYFLAAMAAGPGDQGRYSAFGGGPNVFARIMGIGAIGALFFVMKNRTIWPLMVVPLFALGAVLSGSRGGLLAAGLAVLVSSVPLVRRLGAGTSVAIAAVLSVGLGVANAMSSGRLLDMVSQRFVQQTLVEGYLSGRDVIADEAWRMVESAPLFGVGLDGYGALNQLSFEVNYPHNLFLSAWVEGGIISAALLVVAIAALAWPMLRDRPLSTFALTCGMAATLILIAAQFSGDYYDSRLMWLFLVMPAAHYPRRRNDLRDGSAGRDRSRSPLKARFEGPAKRTRRESQAS